MPEDDTEPVSQAEARQATEPELFTPEPERFGDPEPPLQLDEDALARATRAVVPGDRGPGSLARLLSVIVSVGLAWALAVAITAWLLGLFLARG